ncbi:hypothetical protein XENTR_v10002917 [Xenopus tropicalis]|nr:hypothetical protein XENTR_v10002917 [Xenopus tropicalis]
MSWGLPFGLREVLILFVPIIKICTGHTRISSSKAGHTRCRQVSRSSPDIPTYWWAISGRHVALGPNDRILHTAMGQSVRGPHQQADVVPDPTGFSNLPDRYLPNFRPDIGRAGSSVLPLHRPISCRIGPRDPYRQLQSARVWGP